MTTTERDLRLQHVAHQTLHGPIRRCRECGRRWQFRGYGDRHWYRYPEPKGRVVEWSIWCECGRMLPLRP